jgi:hypothetical protein
MANVVNFIISFDALKDQLLNLVVKKEAENVYVEG